MRNSQNVLFYQKTNSENTIKTIINDQKNEYDLH